MCDRVYVCVPDICTIARRLEEWKVAILLGFVSARVYIRDTGWMAVLCLLDTVADGTCFIVASCRWSTANCDDCERTNKSLVCMLYIFMCVCVWPSLAALPRLAAQTVPLNSVSAICIGSADWQPLLLRWPRQPWWAVPLWWRSYSRTVWERRTGERSSDWKLKFILLQLLHIVVLFIAAGEGSVVSRCWDSSVEGKRSHLSRRARPPSSAETGETPERVVAVGATIYAVTIAESRSASSVVVGRLLSWFVLLPPPLIAWFCRDRGGLLPLLVQFIRLFVGRFSWLRPKLQRPNFRCCFYVFVAAALPFCAEVARHHQQLKEQ